jgi:hypothetical protein
MRASLGGWEFEDVNVNSLLPHEIVNTSMNLVTNELATKAASVQNKKGVLQPVIVSVSFLIQKNNMVGVNVHIMTDLEIPGAAPAIMTLTRPLKAMVPPPMAESIGVAYTALNGKVLPK